MSSWLNSFCHADSFLIAETAEYLVYGLPHSSMKAIVPFFRQIERMKAQYEENPEPDAEFDDTRPIIRDCSISHTSECFFYNLGVESPLTPTQTALEEVFLKITRQANIDEHNLTIDPWEHLRRLSASKTMVSSS